MEAKLKSAARVLIVAVVLTGCGSGGESSTTRPVTGSQPSSGSSNPQTAEGEVPSEAQSAATGDIPDNQVFLAFTDRPAGYSIRYPEGWARKGSGNDVTFKEKANVIHIAVHPGAARSKPGEKLTVSRQSAPDPVTGKRLPLTVDVYEFEHGGKVAVLELSTPVGVDNVDAYRMISESFRWR